MPAAIADGVYILRRALDQLTDKQVPKTGPSRVPGGFPPEFPLTAQRNGTFERETLRRTLCETLGFGGYSDLPYRNCTVPFDE